MEFFDKRVPIKDGEVDEESFKSIHECVKDAEEYAINGKEKGVIVLVGPDSLIDFIKKNGKVAFSSITEFGSSSHFCELDDIKFTAVTADTKAQNSVSVTVMMAQKQSFSISAGKK